MNSSFFRGNDGIFSTRESRAVKWHQFCLSTRQLSFCLQFFTSVVYGSDILVQIRNTKAKTTMSTVMSLRWKYAYAWSSGRRKISYRFTPDTRRDDGRLPRQPSANVRGRVRSTLHLGFLDRLFHVALHRRAHKLHKSIKTKIRS